VLLLLRSRRRWEFLQSRSGRTCGAAVLRVLRVLRVLQGLPVVDSNAEPEGVVDLFFRVVLVVVFAGNGLASRQAVRTLMLLGGDMYELEVEEEDGCDPAVHIVTPTM